MPDKIVIEGIPPYDGEYEFEFGDFTNRELHRIKVVTGLRALDFEEAFIKRDPDLFLGLAMIVLERQGKTVVDDILWDAPVGKLRLIMAEEEEASPPEETQETPEDSPAPLSEPRTSSGDASTDDSAHQGNGLSPTGLPDSPRSVISDQEISAA